MYSSSYRWYINLHVYLCPSNQIIVPDDDEINNYIQMKIINYNRRVKTHAGMQSIVIYINIFHQLQTGITP